MSDLVGIQTKPDELTFSWSPPYTIDGIPILGYESDILILSATNGSLLYAYHESLNNTYLTVSKLEPDNNCVYINISILAANPAGNGDVIYDIFHFSESMFECTLC